MTTFSLITSCMGRLEHLKQTLPLMMEAGADEVIVVDFSCPEGTRGWVAENFPGAKLVCIDGESHYVGARARNLGAAQATSDWLVFIDADIFVSADLGNWIRSNVQPGSFYRAAPVDGLRDPEAFGSSICAPADLEAAGGYDDVMIGWGPEDYDLYRRFQSLGLEQRDYPAGFVKPISHSDEARAGYAPMKTKGQKLTLCICYTEAKVALLQARGRPYRLDRAERQTLMDQIQGQLAEWFAEGAETPLAVRCSMQRHTQLRPRTLTMDVETEVVINIMPDFVTAQEICGFLEVPLPKA